MEYCLIEKWHSDYILPQDCIAIALVPKAAYQLDKAGIKYQTFDDYFSAREIKSNTDNYLKQQVLWFKTFDKFIYNIFPEAQKLDVKLPLVYFKNIKGLIDKLVVASRILHKFLELTNPSTVYYIPQIYGEDKAFRWAWFSFQKSIFYRLISIICEKKKIQLNVLYCKNDKSVINNSKNKVLPILEFTLNPNVKTFSNIVVSLKKWIRRYTCLFTFPQYFKDNKFNVYVVREAYYLNDFYKDCLKHRFNVFYKNDKYVSKLSFFRKRHRLKLDELSNITYLNNRELSSIMDDLLGGDVMAWINEQCGVDVSSIINSRFKYFIKEIFPQTLVFIKAFVDFYQKNNIDFVIVPILSNYEDFSAAVAAKISKKTKCIGLSHGFDLHEVKSKLYSEYIYFDLYCVGDKEEVKHIEDLSKIKVCEYSYLRQQFKKRKKLIRWDGKKNKYYKFDKPIVLFAPITQVERPNMSYENMQAFQWGFFKWHSALIDYFSTRHDFHFIWKTLHQRFGRGDTNSDILRDKSPKNIDYSTGVLFSFFPYADRVICDVPSTAFFECIFYGLPVLTFYRPKDQKLRDDAYQKYGKSLQSYSSVSEGLNKIQTYLDNDKNQYILPYSHKRIDIPEILENTFPK